MVLISPVLAPHLSRSPNPVERYISRNMLQNFHRGRMAAMCLDDACTIQFTGLNVPSHIAKHTAPFRGTIHKAEERRNSLPCLKREGVSHLPLSQAPYFALTSDSCTDRSTKKEEMLEMEEDGDEKERREWLHGQQHDNWKVREMEGSEWPPL